MWLQANSEVSALLGRIPSAVGYQPTLATDLGTLQERITTTKKGSITSVQVFVEPAALTPISMYQVTIQQWPVIVMQLPVIIQLCLCEQTHFKGLLLLLLFPK